jgi:hypothetical protein
MNSIEIFKLLLFSSLSFSNVSRIENFEVNRKEVAKIYMSFSKATIIRFPEAIEEIRIGLPNYYEAEISKIYKKELTLHLIENIKFPSNLIIRTTSETIFVFDLVPSELNHQDVVFIDDSFYPRKPNTFVQKIVRKKIVVKPRQLLFNNN